jgi:hypothetical protein
MLGCPADSNPPFASHLAMEVIEDRQRRQFVRWVFNGRVLGLPEFGQQEIVPLEEFEEKMEAKVRRLCPGLPFD